MSNPQKSQQREYQFGKNWISWTHSLWNVLCQGHVEESTKGSILQFPFSTCWVTISVKLFLNTQVILAMWMKQLRNWEICTPLLTICWIKMKGCLIKLLNRKMKKFNNCWLRDLLGPRRSSFSLLKMIDLLILELNTKESKDMVHIGSLAHDFLFKNSRKFIKLKLI